MGNSDSKNKSYNDGFYAVADCPHDFFIDGIIDWFRSYASKRGDENLTAFKKEQFWTAIEQSASDVQHEKYINMKNQLNQAFDPKSFAFDIELFKTSKLSMSWIIVLISLATDQNGYLEILQLILNLYDLSPSIRGESPLFLAVYGRSFTAPNLIELVLQIAMEPGAIQFSRLLVGSDGKTSKNEVIFQSQNISHLPALLRILLTHLLKHRPEKAELRQADCFDVNKYIEFFVFHTKLFYSTKPFIISSEDQTFSHQLPVMIEMFRVLLEFDNSFEATPKFLKNLVSSPNAMFEPFATAILRECISSGKMSKKLSSNDDSVFVDYEYNVDDLTLLQFVAIRGCAEFLKELVASKNFGGTAEYRNHLEGARLRNGLSILNALHIASGAMKQKYVIMNAPISIDLANRLYPDLAFSASTSNNNLTPEQVEKFVMRKYTETTQVLLTLPGASNAKNEIVRFSVNDEVVFRKVNPLFLARVANNRPLFDLLKANGCTLEGLDGDLVQSVETWLQQA
jgi:hypothetical protein